MAKEGDLGVDHVLTRTDKRFAPLKTNLWELLQTVIDTFGPNSDATEKRQASLKRDKFSRRIFDETSAVFGGLSDFATGRFIRERNPYRVLVDAHLSLGIENADEAYKTYQAYKPTSAIRKINGYSSFRCTLLQLCIERRERLVDHFIAEGGNVAMDLDRGQIEGLWWVLMLRSICWWLSVDVECATSNIPSHYYYSQMPVYLT